jgi:hypothetical protein
MDRIVVGAALFIFGLAVVSGCSALFGPAEQELRVTAERTDYAATYLGGEGSWRQYIVEVVVRTENVGRAPLYIANCGSPPGIPIFGVFQVSGGRGGEPGSAFSPVWACPWFPPIAVAPGEVRVDTLRLRAPSSVDGITGEVMGSLEGVKQIGFDVRTCPEGAMCPAAEHVGRSNAFRVTIPSGS